MADEYHTCESRFFVNLNSADATSYLNDDPAQLSHLVFDFAAPLLLRSGRRPIRITAEVAQFSAYNTLMTVCLNNRQLSILVGATTLTAYISIGAHTSTTIIAWFAASVFAGAGLLLIHDSLSQRFTITAASSAVSFTVLAGSTCQTLLGFGLANNYVSASGALTLPFPGILLGERTVFIHLNDMDTRNICSFRQGQCNLIAVIPVDPLTPAISYSGGCPFLIESDLLERLELRITDSRGNLIDFRGCHWDLVILFSTLRDIPRKHLSFIDAVGRQN